jgi:hypothetical protein
MWQKLVKNYPLVMPDRQALGLQVSVIVRDPRILCSNEIHSMVMEQQKGCVQPRDHHVLIVPWVADNGHVVNRIPRQILELPVAFDQEFDWITRIV